MEWNINSFTIGAVKIPKEFIFSEKNFYMHISHQKSKIDNDLNSEIVDW